MKVFAAIALATACIPSLALTGNQVLQTFNGPTGDLTFLAYMRGVLDSEIYLSLHAKQLKKVGIDPEFGLFCAPAQSTTPQAVAIVKQRLQKHPEETHIEIYVIARLALMEAWPCD